MHGGQIETATAGSAAAGLEDHGLGTELVEFFALSFGCGAVALNKMTVLGYLVGA